MYILRVKDLDGKMEYFCSRNLNDAKIYQKITPKFVEIFNIYDFIDKLPKISITQSDRNRLDDYLLD
jgi:hypothetical protein